MAPKVPPAPDSANDAGPTACLEEARAQWTEAGHEKRELWLADMRRDNSGASAAPLAVSPASGSNLFAALSEHPEVGIFLGQVQTRFFAEQLEAKRARQHNDLKKKTAMARYDSLRPHIEAHLAKGEPLKTLSVTLPFESKPVPQRTLERASAALGLNQRARK